MPAQTPISAGPGVAFIVSAGIVFEVVAAVCSSPQTAELNAEKRAATLMKWVNIGEITALGFVVTAAIFEPENTVPFILGGALGAALMYGFYTHAKKAGLASSAPPTEDW